MDFYKLLGTGIKAIRERRGYSQEQLAGRLRSFGLTNYKRVAVAQLEAGTRKPGVPELVLIAGALDTTLRGLLPDDVDTAIELAPLASVSAGLLRAVLSDHPEAWYDDPPNVPGWDHAGEEVRRFHAQRTQALRVAVALEAESGNVATNALRALANEAEHNVAKRLNVDPVVVCVASEIRWAQSLTDEREKRLARLGGLSMPLGDRAAHRGHITRDLTRELDDFLTTKRFFRKDDDVLAEAWGLTDADSIRAALRAYGDAAERDISHEMGLPPKEAAFAAQSLFGRALSSELAERSELAGASEASSFEEVAAEMRTAFKVKRTDG